MTKEKYYSYKPENSKHDYLIVKELFWHDYTSHQTENTYILRNNGTYKKLGDTEAFAFAGYDLANGEILGYQFALGFHRDLVLQNKEL